MAFSSKSKAETATDVLHCRLKIPKPSTLILRVLLAHTKQYYYDIVIYERDAF